jgi:hypothetical protein
MRRIVFLFSALLVLSAFTVANRISLTVLWTKNLRGDFSIAKKRTIECEAWCYEWAGTNSIDVRAVGDSVICETAMNRATHCSLRLVILKDSCRPTIVLKSIVRNGDKQFACKSGFIKIDPELWRRKIMKADFSFEFENDENARRVFWKGKIWTSVK